MIDTSAMEWKRKKNRSEAQTDGLFGLCARVRVAKAHFIGRKFSQREVIRRKSAWKMCLLVCHNHRNLCRRTEPNSHRNIINGMSMKPASPRHTHTNQKMRETIAVTQIHSSFGRPNPLALSVHRMLQQLGLVTTYILSRMSSCMAMVL